MVKHVQNGEVNLLSPLPPLPLDPAHWKAIFKAMHLSPQQTIVADLAMRDLTSREIAAYIGRAESTVEMHLDRIFARTGVHSRLQLAMRALALSHQVNGNDERPGIG